MIRSLLISLAFLGLMACGHTMEGWKEMVHGAGNVGVGMVKDTVENVDCLVKVSTGNGTWKCIVEEDNTVNESK